MVGFEEWPSSMKVAVFLALVSRPLRQGIEVYHLKLCLRTPDRVSHMKNRINALCIIPTILGAYLIR